MLSGPKRLQIDILEHGSTNHLFVIYPEDSTARLLKRYKNNLEAISAHVYVENSNKIKLRKPERAEKEAKKPFKSLLKKESSIMLFDELVEHEIHPRHHRVRQV